MRTFLVNPVSLKNCVARFGDVSHEILDISALRMVTRAPEEEMTPAEGTFSDAILSLDRFTLPLHCEFRGKGDGWWRWGLGHLVPSAAAALRSFLSPKRVGESLLEDWRSEEVRHYHGLNESELWLDPNGGVLFTYLDGMSPGHQFVLRQHDVRAPIKVGRMAREEYMELRELSGALPLLPLTERETFSSLTECRDIVTNFRPQGQLEFNLKQRLLRVLSENLYSTTDRSEALRPRPRTFSSATPEV